LGEDAGHGLGADAAVDRGHGAVAAVGLVHLAVALRRAAAAEEARARELLDADRQPEVALACLDRHDGRAQSGRTGGASVGDVVDGYARLADLLLQLLTDPGVRGHQVAR